SHPFLSTNCQPPKPTLFPYTTLFRSPGARPGLPVHAHIRRTAGGAGGTSDPSAPEWSARPRPVRPTAGPRRPERRRHHGRRRARSEEHTSELQSPDHLVCRLLLEKKK